MAIFDQTVDFHDLNNQTLSIINISGLHKGPHSSFNGVTLGFALCDLVDVALFCRHTAGFMRQARDRNVTFSAWRHHSAFPPKETNKNRSLIHLKLVLSLWEPLVTSDMKQVESESETVLITYQWDEVLVSQPASFDQLVKMNVQCSCLAAPAVVLKND